LAEPLEVERAEVVPVEEQRSLHGVVEALEEGDDSGFAGAALADERERLTRGEVERKVGEDGLGRARGVGKDDVAELDGAGALFGREPERREGVDLRFTVDDGEDCFDGGDGFRNPGRHPNCGAEADAREEHRIEHLEHLHKLHLPIDDELGADVKAERVHAVHRGLLHAERKAGGDGVPPREPLRLPELAHVPLEERRLERKGLRRAHVGHGVARREARALHLHLHLAREVGVERVLEHDEANEHREAREHHERELPPSREGDGHAKDEGRDAEDDEAGPLGEQTLHHRRLVLELGANLPRGVARAVEPARLLPQHRAEHRLPHLGGEVDARPFEPGTSHEERHEARNAVEEEDDGPKANLRAHLVLRKVKCVDHLAHGERKERHRTARNCAPDGADAQEPELGADKARKPSERRRRWELLLGILGQRVVVLLLLLRF